MYLTIKWLIETIIFAVIFFILGSVNMVLGLIFTYTATPVIELMILGIICYILVILIVLWEIFAVGKARVISMGHKLIRKELRPEKFIEYYTSDIFIIKKPCVEVLQLVAVAYSLLDDKENELATIDEMIAIANEKKKSFVYLLKCSFLFSKGEVEEAELLFNEVQKEKLDLMSSAFADAILKSDRAKAMGDYKTVETYSLKMLEGSFQKPDNLGKLCLHYNLGEVYEKLQDNSRAILHYQYCVEYGGETGLRKSAVEKLENMK